MQSEEFYPRNKKRNGNLSCFYQEQYNQLKRIIKYMTKNYLQQWKLLQNRDLLDTNEKFKVWIDHQIFKYFQKPHKLNKQQVRQYLKLQDYNFILQHIPGKTNTRADILSRKNQVNTVDDNKDIKMLKDELQIR